MASYGFTIPVYRHASTLESVVKSLLHHKLPIIVVDDGNSPKDRGTIQKVVAKYSLTLITHPKNLGKGKAIKSAIFCAHKMGLTHLFQIDADGQHDASRVGQFLQLSRLHPDAIITGCPEYDKSAPTHRVKGRQVANTWVKIVTFSTQIADAMIGFRIYPVDKTYKLEKSPAIIDSRMASDIDLLVHLVWRGVPVINETVKISYPLDGVSNFRVVRDNVRISAMYTRLFFGALARFPILLTRAVQRHYTFKTRQQFQSVIAQDNRAVGD